MHRSLRIHIAAAFAVCLAIGARIAEAVADTIRFVIEAVASPFKPAFAFDGATGLVTSSPGTALDRTLQNDLRHEAGVSRRSAARHI